MTNQPKFTRGEKVSVANGVGSHVTGFSVVHETRQVVDIRSREGRFEYQMFGASYWIPERRVSALDAPAEEPAPAESEAMPLVCAGDLALRRAERVGPFVI